MEPRGPDVARDGQPTPATGQEGQGTGPMHAGRKRRAGKAGDHSSLVPRRRRLTSSRSPPSSPGAPRAVRRGCAQARARRRGGQRRERRRGRTSAGAIATLGGFVAPGSPSPRVIAVTYLFRTNEASPQAAPGHLPGRRAAATARLSCFVGERRPLVSVGVSPPVPKGSGFAGNTGARVRWPGIRPRPVRAVDRTSGGRSEGPGCRLSPRVLRRWTPARVGDPKVGVQFLSIRGVGWTSSGPLSTSSRACGARACSTSLERTTGGTSTARRRAARQRGW
jgi:hypothetical protein